MSFRVEQTKYFAKSLTFLILARGISLLFRLVSRIIIARFSSTEVFGAYSVIWNEVAFVSTVVLIGLGQQLTIELPRKDETTKSKLIYSSIFYALIVGILSAVISLVFYLIRSDNTFLFSMFISAIFITFLVMQFIFIGLKDFLGYFILIATENILLLVFILIFRKNLSVQLLVLGLFITTIISVLISVLYLIKKHKISWKILIKQKKSIFKFSKRRIYLFIVDIVNSGILYLLVKIPQLIENVTLSAYVSVAFSIMSFVLIIPQIISTSMGPLLSENYFKNDTVKLNSNLRTGSSLLYVSQGLINIIFAFFGGLLIKILYGNTYYINAYSMYAVFLVAMIADSFKNVVGVLIRNTDNEDKFALGKLISFFAFIIVEVIALIYFDSKGIGIAFAYYINVSILLIYYMFFAIKINKQYNKNDLRKFILWFVFNMIIVNVGLVFSQRIQKLYILIIVTLAAIVVFSLFLVLMKVINVKAISEDFKTLIISRLNRKKNKN